MAIVMKIIAILNVFTRRTSYKLFFRVCMDDFTHQTVNEAMGFQ